MKNLTDAKIASAKKGDRRYGLYDGDDLWLLIYPSGRKTWNMIYTNEEGKSRQVFMGQYPVLTLLEAREKLIEMKRKVLIGLDPLNPDRSPSMRDAALIWYEEWRKGKKPDTEKAIWALFENHIFPTLGTMPVIDIKTDHVEDLALSIQASGLYSTVRYVLIYLKKVFRFKPVRKLCHGHDPVSCIKSSDLLNRYEKKHRARIPLNEFPSLIEALDRFPDLKTRYALQLMLLFWVRTVELLGAQWNEFDFNENLWRIPASRMKMKREHLVPLSTQAVELLKNLKAEGFDHDGLFFKDSQVNEGLLLDALYEMGYKSRMTTHGFRSLASTKLHEKMWEHRAIETQLSHIETNASALAYNASDYLDYRREMMQAWADYVDTFRLDGHRRVAA